MRVTRRLGLLMALAGAAWGANGDRIVVQLRLNRDAPQPLFGLLIDFAASAGSTPVGKALGGVVVRAEPAPGGPDLAAQVTATQAAFSRRRTCVPSAQPPSISMVTARPSAGASYSSAGRSFHSAAELTL